MARRRTQAASAACPALLMLLRRVQLSELLLLQCGRLVGERLQVAIARAAGRAATKEAAKRVGNRLSLRQTAARRRGYALALAVGQRRCCPGVVPCCPKARLRAGQRLDELAQLADRRQQFPLQSIAQVNLELVELAHADAAALSHEDVGVEDIIGCLRCHQKRGDEQAVDVVQRRTVRRALRRCTEPSQVPCGDMKADEIELRIAVQANQIAVDRHRRDGDGVEHRRRAAAEVTVQAADPLQSHCERPQLHLVVERSEVRHPNNLQAADTTFALTAGE
mmetsp:Transcript_33306/g.87663  ORF Transcript_33306/g.87663 Transcript_33306/m.87663 type:complete len:279 (-) Transcript_33306:80-916(-)|eukprot:CAMPEP_0115855086 /NCGR_PEP_ID=MMETSP0287-20121206/14363_1 /TAXON_ID=412157 /ORGANISM="Chrysochromulina rotalis, Strain UIO044" /LENGTH=278 /DNA_ID=CAMNT_0003309233 /DNA_START=498 /DNA_END=1334 /DNA_ORIENTATION=+